MSSLWESAPASHAQANARNPASRLGWPAHLHMRALDHGAHVVRVSFYLGRLRALSPCELEVARWASHGFSNADIAARRSTSIHTVARQAADGRAKLRIGSRLDLATIAELTAWALPTLTTEMLRPANENGADVNVAENTLEGDKWLKEEGHGLAPGQVARIWREIASGQWTLLASEDIGAIGYVALRRGPCRDIAWETLSEKQRAVLHEVAHRTAQKVIAMKLGLAPSTVSASLRGARRKLGFASFAQLVKAYCAVRDVIEQTGRDAVLAAMENTEKAASVHAS